MWDWLNARIVSPLIDLVNTAIALVLPNVITIIGFVLALAIIIRMINERRNPSNFFAWFFFVVFVPILGVPLYFLFGGRKSRRLARLKREVQGVAESLVDEEGRDPLEADPLVYANTRGASADNRIELLGDGQVAFERICDEIRNAEKSIHIATFILSNDVVGDAVIELLKQRAAEGVEVLLLLDALGCWPGLKKSRREIEAAGGQTAMFIPVLPLQSRVSANLRNHRKVAIFDHSRAITGGQNLDNRFLGTAEAPAQFHDFSIYVEGPAVRHLNRIFIADWAFAAKQSPERYRELLQFKPVPAGRSTVEVIPSGPDVTGDPLWEQLLRIVQEFKQHLTIITPYFVPDEVLFRSLMVKAHTGRRIRLVLPLKSNHRVADIARYHFLRQLDEAGVKILFYAPRMLHGKLILADDSVAMTGSANIDMRSLFVNFEIGLFHYSAKDLEAFSLWADDILANSIPFSEAKRTKAGKPSRILEDFVHLIVPLL